MGALLALAGERGDAECGAAPDCVALRGCRPLVVGFGMATWGDRPCTDPCGAMPYKAPEVLLRSSYDGGKCDVFALGVVLLEAMCGLGSFQGLMGWAGAWPGRTMTVPWSETLPLGRMALACTAASPPSMPARRRSSSSAFSGGSTAHR